MDLYKTQKIVVMNLLIISKSGDIIYVGLHDLLVLTGSHVYILKFI